MDSAENIPQQELKLNGLEEVRSATDKEQLYRTVTAEIQKIKYTPINELAEEQASRTDEKLVDFVVNMSESRGMTPSQFLTLAACTNDSFLESGKKITVTFSPDNWDTIKRIMTKNPKISGSEETISRLKKAAETNNIAPSDLMKRYGATIAEEAASFHEGGREGLKKEIAEDINSKEPPWINRSIRSSEAEQEKLHQASQEEIKRIREQLDAIRAKKPTMPIDATKFVDIQNLQLTAQLAQQFKVPWEELDKTTRKEILNLPVDKKITELAKLSTIGQKHKAEMAEIRQTYEKQMEDLQNQ